MKNNIISKVILKNIIKPDVNPKVKDLLAGLISDYSLEYIATLIDNPDYEFLNTYDYFKTLYDKNLFTADLDQLYDLGLFKNGYVYGQVYDSDDWDSNFNQYHYKMKCKVFLYDDELKLTKLDTALNTCNLIKINKSEIKYFNHASNITSTT
jgi:hypothetical protein